MSIIKKYLEDIIYTSNNIPKHELYVVKILLYKITKKKDKYNIRKILILLLDHIAGIKKYQCLYMLNIKLYEDCYFYYYDDIIDYSKSYNIKLDYN